MSEGAEPRGQLVFHLGALGDFILTWPLLAAIRRLSPGTPLTLACTERHAELARGIGHGDLPLVDGVVPLDGRRFTPLFGDDRSEDAPLREFLSGFDRILSFLGPADSHFHRRVRELFGGKLLSVDSRPRPGERRPIGEQWFDQLPEACRPAAADFRWCGPEYPGLPEAFAVIHPGSGGRDKCWPPERFAAVADEWLRIGLHSVFVVGEVEHERGLRPGGSRTVLTDLTLPRLAAVCARAAVFVGNDSGPAHLAAAMGTPTVAVFRITDPLVWAPQGRFVRTVGPGRPSPPPSAPGSCPRSGGAIVDPEVEEVVAAAAGLMRLRASASDPA